MNEALNAKPPEDLAAENSAESPPKRRVIGRPFVKGAASPNPGGRPKVLPDVQAMFRRHTPEALAALLRALKQPRYRVAAAATILAYGWGRPMTMADVARADAGDDSTTFVLKIVSAADHSESGSNGATPPGIISIPHQVNNDEDD